MTTTAAVDGGPPAWSGGGPVGTRSGRAGTLPPPGPRAAADDPDGHDPTGGNGHRAGTDVQPGPKTRRELPGRMGRLAPVLVSRAGLSPVMVGRDAELGQLLRLSGGSAAAGNGGAAGAAVALVGGEPGIGKTRLVSELIGALAPVSRVLTGQADPGALGSPFHLLLDLRPEMLGRLGHLPPLAEDVVERAMQPLALALYLTRRRLEPGEALAERRHAPTPVEVARADAESCPDEETEGEHPEPPAHGGHILLAGAAGP